MSIENELSEIRSQISTVQAKKARAHVEIDNATERLAEAKTTLERDFKVETNDEAKAMLAKLETQLENAVSAVKSALEEAGA